MFRIQTMFFLDTKPNKLLCFFFCLFFSNRCHCCVNENKLFSQNFDSAIWHRIPAEGDAVCFCTSSQVLLTHRSSPTKLAFPPVSVNLRPFVAPYVSVLLYFEWICFVWFCFINVKRTAELRLSFDCLSGFQSGGCSTLGGRQGALGGPQKIGEKIRNKM